MDFIIFHIIIKKELLCLSCERSTVCQTECDASTRDSKSRIIRYIRNRKLNVMSYQYYYHGSTVLAIPPEPNHSPQTNRIFNSLLLVRYTNTYRIPLCPNTDEHLRGLNKSSQANNDIHDGELITPFSYYLIHLLLLLV
jgi:hypothetical protein